MIIHPEYKYKRWQPQAKMPEGFSELLGFKETPLHAQLLFNRGMTDRLHAQKYLAAAVDANTDPYQLPGMTKVIERILEALRNDESIAIYGDYDVDGVTATVLLVELFNGLGAKVQAYIPDRFDEGYGLNVKALDDLKEQNVSLVITVDCGVRSVIEAEHCREINLDLIITDHHHPEKNIPAAIAVVNPKLEDSEYPYKELVGVGVAYKLAQALMMKIGQTSDLGGRWLDLVALGTVADMGALTGENRKFVRDGIMTMRTGSRLGIKALCAGARVEVGQLSAGDIGFMLGPRLNAAGRLDTAMTSYHLLISTEPAEAQKLANTLNNQNSDRQEATRAIQSSAMDKIGELKPDDYLLFVVDGSYSEGIVGLAASRLVDQFNRPAIVGRQDETTTRCSCRSISAFHITQALDECADLLVRHGGHAAAAGFTVENKNLAALEAQLKGIANRELCAVDLTPVQSADAEVELKELNMGLLAFLEQLQPTGYGNPSPVFIANNLKIISSRAIGAESKHLKLMVTDGWLTFDAIAFRFGYLAGSLPERVDLSFTFEKNIFNGKESLQLNVKDIH